MFSSRGSCSVNFVKLLLPLLFIVKCAHAYGTHDPGEIYPTIAELAVGGSVNITCRMNPTFFPGRNASVLRFINSYTNETVPSEDVVVVNATTIVYMLRNATEQSTTLLCKSGHDAIMYMKLYVGSPPSDVTNFRCRNYDYEYMICNFTQPKNPVLTQYNLTYYLVSPRYVYSMHCNYEAKPLVVCNITLNEKSRTHLEHFMLKFLLRAANTLGNKLQHYSYNAIDITVPTTTGEELKVLNMTTDTLKLSWKMPKYDLYRARGLQWEVIVQPLDRDSIDFSNNVAVERRGHSELLLHLSGLPYAYYEYTVHIRARVESSIATASSAFNHNHYNVDDVNNENEDLWSIPFVYSFRSKARLPDRPPRTDVGSFYINAMETHVSLYWEELEPHEYNGDQFRYVVDVRRDGHITSLAPVLMELNSAIFEWHKDSYYRYEIRSQNHMGISKQFSIIEIPIQSTRNQRTHTPPAVHNVYHATNNSYTLTWLAPSEMIELQDFTVYWCSSKRALQNECQGSIYFEHVDRSARNFTTLSQPLQQEHILNFAVSANYIDYNTGMHWTPCTMDVNSDLVKMEPEAQAISATTIKVQWMLERICLSVISGYNLTYCELSSNDSTTCLPDSTRNFTLEDKNMKKFELSKLQPYTVYQVKMLMFSSLKASKFSEPLVVRTLEAAPSPPRQLRQVGLTSNRANISWLAPANANGRIRHYLINYNEYSVRLNVTADMESDSQYEYELHNLSSYTDYRVYVSGYTNAASLPSNELQLHTLIGEPSMPGGTFALRDNDSFVQWSRPAEPAGRLEYYELAVTQLSREKVVRRRISIVIGATSCRLPIPGCIDPKQRLIFEVRAVNAALLTHEVVEDKTNNNDTLNTGKQWESYSGNDDLECIGGNVHGDNLENYNNPLLYRLYYSEWRRGPTYGCSANPFDKNIVYIIICSFVVALLVMALTYVARKKIIKMSNIECTLPPGLATYLTKDGVAAIMQSDGTAMAGKIYANLYGGSSHHQQQHHHQQQQHIHHNEKHHLLSAVGNDSGYLGDSHTLERNMSAAASNGCLRTISESSSADSMIDSNGSSSMEHELDELDINGASLTPTITTSSFHNTLPRINEEYVSNTLPNSIASVQAGNATSGYVNPTKILNWKANQSIAPIATETELQPLAQQPPQTFNNYVAVNSLSATKPTGYGVSGYVQPSQLPKLFNPASTNSTTTATPTPSSAASCYTTLEQLGKMQQSPPPAISGYVTQRELNQFSQQHCN